MTSYLFVLNDASYGNERANKSLQLAGAPAHLADWTAEADKVLVF